MESTTADELFDAIVHDVGYQRRIATDAAVVVVKERLGVPVERVGSKVIRSKRGEPARKDTGDLQESITGDVIAEADVIESAISTDRPYGPPLETTLERLVLSDLADDFTDKMMDADVLGIEGA